MKVIFLDIGGVLHVADVSMGRPITPHCAKQLARILDSSPDIEMVFTALQRHDKCFMKVVTRQLGELGIKPHFDCTPHLEGQPRSREIRRWLDRNKNVSKFVILDDGVCASDSFTAKYHVLTSPKTGLDKASADLAIDTLRD